MDKEIKGFLEHYRYLGYEVELKSKKHGQKETRYIESQDSKVVAKDCGKCRMLKSEKDFQKHNKHWSGLQPNCRDCNNNYYQNNKPRYIKHFKTNYKNNREYFDNYNAQPYRRFKDKYLLMKYKTEELGGFSDLSEEEYKNLLETKECFLSGNTENLTFEHFIPQSLQGDHSIGNVIRITGEINSSKKNRNPLEWIENLEEGKFGITQEKFNQTLEHLAEQNNMTVKEYKNFINWAFSEDRAKKTDSSISLVEIYKEISEDSETQVTE